MKIFFDTEFIEDGKTVDLVSIGMVREDGETYYAVSSEYNPVKASDWVMDHVLVHILSDHSIKSKSRDWIRSEILKFAGDKPEFWGYYADYDWVALCQLFGRMVDLPKHWPKFCLDVKQEAVRIGNPTLPVQTTTQHHALQDALWIRQAWTYLVEIKTEKIKPGDRVRLLSDSKTCGTVTFVNGYRITVLVDGYEASNGFDRAELEIL